MDGEDNAIFELDSLTLNYYFSNLVDGPCYFPLQISYVSKNAMFFVEKYTKK